MATYNWYPAGASLSGCPGTALTGGWYLSGTNTPLVTSYLNPSTGKPYTLQELTGLSGGATTPTTSQLETGGTVTPTDTWNPFHAGWNATPEEQAIAHEAYISGGWGGEAGGAVTAPTTAPTIANLEVPQAPTLPPYKPTAELEALSTQVGGAISGIIAEGGIGMGEETKEQLFLREAEIINASTAQAQRNLEDKMAAQGLSDSGMAFSEGMKLASKSTIAMANVMRDVAIQDSLMKIASYQNALGLGVQFLSYLSEESWRQYQPVVEQWKAQVDMYKLAIQDAYNKQDLALAHRYDMELSQFQAQTQKELAQMEIDAAAKAAKKKNWWDIAGVGLGLVAASL